MPRRAMRCTPRSMSPRCGRTWRRPACRASRCTARRADRRTYLLRPDLGRRLRERIAPHCRPRRAPSLFVVCDGLSATAVQRHARAAGPRRSHAAAHGHAVAPIVVAEQGRVALGDDIGEAMGAEAVAVLIGERPGLSAADSLGVYLTWQPRRGRTDAERNCISNIRPDGPGSDGGGEQAALADRCDATAAPDRRRPEGRAARHAQPLRPAPVDELPMPMPDGAAKPDVQGGPSCRQPRCGPFWASLPRQSRC